jgi:hypothetical protein
LPSGNTKGRFQSINVHFFCSSKRNEPKKKRPEMTTSAKTGACYTCLVGATVLAELRTISGLPAHLYLENSLLAS